MRKTCLKIGGGQRFEFGGQKKLYHRARAWRGKRGWGARRRQDASGPARVAESPSTKPPPSPSSRSSSSGTSFICRICGLRKKSVITHILIVYAIMRHYAVYADYAEIPFFTQTLRKITQKNPLRTQLRWGGHAPSTGVSSFFAKNMKFCVILMYYA